MNSYGHKLNLKGKKAEKALYNLAAKTFLSDWCYLRPKVSHGHELCDLLVVYDEIAIIWQLKNLKVKKNGQYSESKVQKNLRQLSGAKRTLFNSKKTIILENPRRGKKSFDPAQINSIFLISAFFGPGVDFFNFGDEYKNHSVHVFTRNFIEIVLGELDTITDFVDYLQRKEELFEKMKRITIIGGEEDLLALYIMNGRNFRKLEKADAILIEGGDWDNLSKSKKYINKKRADKISYCWDNIIDRAHEGGKEYEVIARELARPNRFHRRFLSKVFFEAQIRADSEKGNNIFRRVLNFEGVTYCFLFLDENAKKEQRLQMLSNLCFIARGKHRKNKTVIGIATEMKLKELCSYDFCLFEKPRWTKKNQEDAEKLQKETGILTRTTRREVTEDEFPEN